MDERDAHIMEPLDGIEGHRASCADDDHSLKAVINLRESAFSPFVAKPVLDD
jgi:hypothetical protein